MSGRLGWLSLSLVLALAPALLQAGFGYKDVIERARQRAAEPYHAPASIPDWLRELDYSDYEGIRFDPRRNLWRQSHSRFQVMLVPAGLYFKHPVAVNVIDSQGVQRLGFDKAMFTFSDPDVEKRIPADLGYAGFKLTYPFSGPDSANQFLVFAGASYLRGVGSDNAFGLSARGLAIDTGLTRGEEFPAFVEFWLERPAADADSMVIYGLLDGPSVTGAYRFVVHPGSTTRLAVEATLFARADITLPGVAPLTSMFLYGENTPRPPGHWRPEVHDSDGLLIHDGPSGEWLWRPLLNPRALQVDYLQVHDPHGFGLLQRDVAFDHYQDLGAQYQRRPSAWVETDGQWGEGNIVLVQLPTPDETNDNIVAFWSPRDKFKAGSRHVFKYRLSFGADDVDGAPLGHTVNTFVGDGNQIGGGNQKGAYRVIVDFAGGPLDGFDRSAKVTASVTGQEGTDIIEQFVEYNAPRHAWRLSLLARPKQAQKALALRAYLAHDGQAITETWTYRLPGDNAIRASEQ